MPCAFVYGFLGQLQAADRRRRSVRALPVRRRGVRLSRWRKRDARRTRAPSTRRGGSRWSFRRGRASSRSRACRRRPRRGRRARAQIRHRQSRACAVRTCCAGGADERRRVAGGPDPPRSRRERRAGCAIRHVGFRAGRHRRVVARHGARRARQCALRPHPERLHKPLRQRMVLTKRAQAAARAFYRYLQQAPAAAFSRGMASPYRAIDARGRHGTPALAQARHR